MDAENYRLFNKNFKLIQAESEELYSKELKLCTPPPKGQNICTVKLFLYFIVSESEYILIPEHYEKIF
jgi:hypothetical protein